MHHGYIFDAHMYVACIYDPLSFTLMQVTMILDHEACISDAVLFGDGRKDGQADSRSWISYDLICQIFPMPHFKYTFLQIKRCPSPQAHIQV